VRLDLHRLEAQATFQVRIVTARGEAVHGRAVESRN